MSTRPIDIVGMVDKGLPAGASTRLMPSGIPQPMSLNQTSERDWPAAAVSIPRTERSSPIVSPSPLIVVRSGSAAAASAPPWSTLPPAAF